jgi:3-oxoacyl-(acyl-carrier-protein) synthase
MTTTAAPALVTVATGGWPEPGDPATAPPIAGFVVSTFTPIVAAAAERCLTRARRDGAVPCRTAVVIVSSCGDVASARHVAAAVDAGARIGPLMFFQSVPNAVAGHLAARHGLDGPVVCLSPAGDPLAEGLAEAALLIADEDLDAALVVVADQEPDAAHAVLVRPGDVNMRPGDLERGPA